MKVTSEKSGLFTMIPSSLARVDMVAHGRCPMRTRGSVRVRIRTEGPFGFGDRVALCSRLRSDMLKCLQWNWVLSPS